MGIMCMISFGLAQFRAIDSLGPTSTLGVTAVIIFVAVAFMRGVREGRPSEVTMFNWQPRAFQTIPLIFFAIFCHVTVVPATAQLQEYWPSKTRPGKTRYRSLVGVCCMIMVLCLCLYCPSGLSGYFLYGENTQEDVLVNM